MSRLFDEAALAAFLALLPQAGETMAYRLVTGSIVDFVDAAWADIHTEIIARRETDQPSVIAISRHSALELIVASPQGVIVWHTRPIEPDLATLKAYYGSADPSK